MPSYQLACRGDAFYFKVPYIIELEEYDQIEKGNVFRS